MFDISNQNIVSQGFDQSCKCAIDYSFFPADHAVHIRRCNAELICKLCLGYSSFNAQSLGTLRRLLPDADIGMLSDKASDCLKMMSGPCRVDAIHPCGEEIDLPPEKLAGMTVRAWFTGPLYPEKGGERMNLTAYEAMGVTDVFINDPEEYL